MRRTKSFFRFSWPFLSPGILWGSEWGGLESFFLFFCSIHDTVRLISKPTLEKSNSSLEFSFFHLPLGSFHLKSGEQGKIFSEARHTIIHLAHSCWMKCRMPGMLYWLRTLFSSTPLLPWKVKASCSVRVGVFNIISLTRVDQLSSDGCLCRLPGSVRDRQRRQKPGCAPPSPPPASPPLSLASFNSLK